MNEMLVGIMVIYAMSVACVVEFYKVQCRGGKAKAWESLLIAGTLSAVGGWCISDALAKGLAVPFMVILFAVQYLIDMEVVKRVFKAIMEKVINE